MKCNKSAAWVVRLKAVSIIASIAGAVLLSYMLTHAVPLGTSNRVKYQDQPWMGYGKVDREIQASAEGFIGVTEPMSLSVASSISCSMLYQTTASDGFADKDRLVCVYAVTQNFLSKGHKLQYYTTVQGPDIFLS